MTRHQQWHHQHGLWLWRMSGDGAVTAQGAATLRHYRHDPSRKPWQTSSHSSVRTTWYMLMACLDGRALQSTVERQRRRLWWGSCVASLRMWACQSSFRLTGDHSVPVLHSCPLSRDGALTMFCLPPAAPTLTAKQKLLWRKQSISSLVVMMTRPLIGACWS